MIVGAENNFLAFLELHLGHIGCAFFMRTASYICSHDLHLKSKVISLLSLVQRFLLAQT